MKPFQLNNKGVTLVELLVVLVVLTVGLIPIALVQLRANKDVFHSGQRTEALSIAQMRMEQVKSMGFNNAVSNNGTVGIYSWNTNIQPAGSGINSVTITVQWPEDGEQRDVTIRNMVAGR